MTNTLRWRQNGVSFEDGSRLADWTKIHESRTWMWQKTHELSFDIYEHDGRFWKLYRTRFAHKDGSGYRFGYGGQACRVVLVRYRRAARSPHSSLLKQAGDEEWVRTYEVDEAVHYVIRAGHDDPEYGASDTPKRAA